MVRRRCQAGFRAFLLPEADRVWAAANTAGAAEEDGRARGGDLADAIGRLVPDAAPARRRMLLAARRDAFNLRPCRDPDLPAAVSAAYREALDTAGTARQELDNALDRLAASTVALLRDRLADPAFARSVELSVPGLVAEAGRAGALGYTGARVRRRTLTLFRLVQRAAGKPTPFAWFTETTVLVPGGREEPPHGVRLVDRRALDWVAHWLRTEGVRSVAPEQIWLTTNPSAVVDAAGQRVRWIGESGDSVRGAPCPQRLSAVLRRLRRPARLSDLSPEGVSPPLLALIRCGLLEVGFPLPSHGPAVLGGLPARLSASLDSTTAAVGAAAHALAALEADGSGGGPVPVGTARAALSRLAAACGVPDDSTQRVPFTEDFVGAAGTGAPVLSDDVLADLALIQRLGPLLGPQLPFQLAGLVAFREQFGESEVDVLTAYDWFVRHGRERADTLASASVHPLLAEVLGLRAELTGHLRRLATKARGTEEVSCDAGFLHELVARIPALVMPWSCVAWPMQFAGGRTVLNGIGCGYGYFAGRAGAGLADPPLERLRRWADEAGRPDPTMVTADLPARLGSAANEHPRLLSYVLALPGHALECDPAHRVDLADCTVQVDPERGWLTLRSRRMPERALLPVPQNATITRLAPPLHRWLARLGPVIGSTLPLWDWADARAAGTDEIRHYPRLMAGRVVVCRRTWKVPGSLLPRAGDSDAETVLAQVRWCRSTGVPRRSFVRATTPPEPWDVVRGRAANRDGGGASAYKPAYTDLAHPLCWPSVQGRLLTFTEALPDPAAAPDGEPVTEYVVETSLASPYGREG